MKTAGYVSLVLAIALVAFVAGSRWSGQPPGQAPQPQKILYYACPMHPQYHSDRPGDCPSCGMRLEPVAADRSAGRSSDGAGDVRPPSGSIQVSSERQQTIGVRLGVAEKASGTRTLRTTGRVAADENAIYPLVSGVDARVRDVGNPTAGTLVKKDQVLASLYAPELLANTQSYLIALNAFEGAASQNVNQATAAKTNLQRAEESLRNLGVSEGHIDQLRRDRQSLPTITIASPVDGFVLQRNVLVGQRVDRGTELYRVADLRRVWILTDVYENQVSFIRSGMRATVTSTQHDRQYQATVSAAQPVFDEATRTMKVRLETDNPGFVLKPGMFVDVAFAIELPETLAVPAEAIVDTGLRKTLFVDRGNGFFEPRQVETGWRIGDQVEVTKGLMAGERIVISGTFLIDSESRMKAAASKGSGTVTKDPVCGMDVDPPRAAAAGRTSVYRGATYVFCSDLCKKQFDQEPGKYAAR
jgi:Cu(I)/Ag(I) efflux system membrane fusion protein